MFFPQGDVDSNREPAISRQSPRDVRRRATLLHPLQSDEPARRTRARGNPEAEGVSRPKGRHGFGGEALPHDLPLAGKRDLDFQEWRKRGQGALNRSSHR